jgi:protein-disulfide isomerase
VLDKYPKKVKLVFKNFPLTSLHPFAHTAAVAALAADGQGKFWEFHKRLFEKQDALNDAVIQGIAREHKLNIERFNRTIQDPAIQRVIARDMAEGEQAGIAGIPIVFVNGKLPKQSTLEGIEELIKAELKKEKNK